MSELRTGINQPNKPYLSDVQTVVYSVLERTHLNFSNKLFLKKKASTNRLIINPLSLNSDQHQFSPDNIRPLSRDTVMRINKMITKEKMP